MKLTIKTCLALMTMIHLASCSAVNSYGTIGDYKADGTQRAGTYFAAKHLVRVRLYDDAKRMDVDSVATQDALVQLDTGFALSPLSDDDIKIEFENGLLKSVAATLTDKSGEILIEVARIVARFRATTDGDEPSRSFYFDPYNYKEAMEVNEILNKEKSCVEVELKPGVWSPGCGNLSIGDLFADASYSDIKLSKKPSQGIYYRRPVDHRVHVVERSKSTQIKPLPFANGQPLFRVDIRRSIFVSRQTIVNFTQGALTSVQVIKPSELLAASKLPLQILEAVVAAPVDGATGGNLKARAAVNQAEANKRNAEAAVSTALASQIAAGNQGAITNTSVRLTEAVMTPDERKKERRALSPAIMAECDNFGLTPEKCVDYVGNSE